MKQPVDGEPVVKPAPDLVSEHGKGQNRLSLTRPVAPAHKQGPAKKVPQTVETFPSVRQKIAAVMDATVANEPGWHYHAVRPLSYPSLVQAEHGAVSSDCSFGCSILAKLAGAGDPLGQHFSGWGNSSSMFERCVHVPEAQALVGDFAVFGHVNGELHAVCIRRTGPDPTCWSHGQEKGPMFVPLSVEKTAHPGAAVTFLRLPIL